MAKTLLLADDSVTIQKVVSISFASEDVTLVTVDNGDDAVERAKETRPDLILADVVMPGKSGYEVCEEIKASPDLQHIPVLLLSGTFEAFDEERAARAGAAGHVAKPFEAQTLVDQVNQLLAAAPPPAAATTPAPAPLAMPEAVTVLAEPQDPDSFDFFNDDFSDLDASADAAPHEGVALDEMESAFAFGDDDLTPVETPPPVLTEEPPPPPPPLAPAAPDEALGNAMPFPDRTVAILPDDAGAAAMSAVPPTELADDIGDAGLGDVGDDLLATPDVELEDSFVTSDPAASSDEGFDFSFERESTAPESVPVETVLEESAAVDPGADDLVAGTVLDPQGAAEFDIAPPETVEPYPAEPMAAPDPAPDSTRLLDADAMFEEPMPMAMAEAEVAEVEVAEESASPAELLPVLEPATPEPALDAAPSALPPADEARPLPDDSAARAEAVLAEITPNLQAVVHDTLEKIAWEAFGEVTEKIVRDAIDRVEKIAWEVVPQLAETLIKAEIHRMKGEDDG